MWCPTEPTHRATIKLDPGTSSIDVTVTNVKVEKGNVYARCTLPLKGFPERRQSLEALSSLPPTRRQYNVSTITFPRERMR